MIVIDLMHRVDAGPQASPALDLEPLTQDELDRVRRGHESLKRRIAVANRKEDAAKLKAALELLAQED